MASGMRILSASDYRVMPWKNGGGTTTEVAISPPGATVADFDWRVSMASVASDGPFSLFDGIDRTLSILSGDGLGLSVDGGDAVTLERHSAPFFFAADRPASARLLGAPVVDLNVMTRRGRWRHTVARIEADGTIELDGTTLRIVYVAAGSIAAIGAQPVGVEAGNSVLWDAPDGGVDLTAADAVLFVIELDPVT